MNIKVTIFLVQVPVQSSLMTQERSAVLTFCQQQRFHLSEKKNEPSFATLRFSQLSLSVLAVTVSFQVQIFDKIFR